MPKVARKKKFRGKNQWEAARENSSSELASTSNECNTSSPSLSTSVEQTASARKIGNQSQGRSELSEEGSYSYRLIELSSLMRSFKMLHQCEAGGELTFNDDQDRRYGNSSVIQIECTKCDTEFELQTSEQ